MPLRDPTAVRQTGGMRSTGEPADDQRVVRALLLLQRYSNAMTRIAVDSLVEGDGTNNEVGLLLSLHFDGPQSPSELAQARALDRSQTSRMLRRLEAAGMVTRAADRKDGRRSTVRLTPRGRRRIEAFDAALSEYFVTSAPMMSEALTLMGVQPSPGDPPVGGALESAARLTAVGQAFVARAVEELGPFGVGNDTGERFVLGLLLARGAQRPGTLADALERSPAFTSARLGRLEAAGLVTRRLEGGSDGRAVLVDLTATGRLAAEVYLRAFAADAAQIGEALEATLHAAPALEESDRTG